MPAPAGSAGFDSAMGAEGGAAAGSLHRPPIPYLRATCAHFTLTSFPNKHKFCSADGMLFGSISLVLRLLFDHTYIFKDVWHKHIYDESSTKTIFKILPSLIVELWLWS